MLNSALYGLAVLAILLIMRWYIDNDGNGQDDGSIGLLAMKTGKEKGAASSRPVIGPEILPAKEIEMILFAPGTKRRQCAT